MITENMIENIVGPTIEQLNNSQQIPGVSFNKCFKEIKYFLKNGGFQANGTSDNDVQKIFQTIDKKNIIIFSPDKTKLDSMNDVSGKIIFPFDNIFLEYPTHHFTQDSSTDDVIFKFTNGFFLRSIKDDNSNVKAIFIFSMWFDYGSNPNNLSLMGVTPRCMFIPYDNINKKILFDDFSTEDKVIGESVANSMKKICYLIQKKEYNEYYKWLPSGIVNREITYSHDVKSHKRHFWKDSGKFKIPLLPKQEILDMGYGIDECVFRGYELRRDVPYKIIGVYKVGENKKNINDNNRIINILKKRTFRNEEKLGFILSKIFTDYHIKKHDRRRIKPLELDFYIHDLKLAFEYDGEQHYDKKICEDVFKSDFKAQHSRDIKKNAMCRRKKIILIRVKYDEILNVKNIKRLIKISGFNL